VHGGIDPGSLGLGPKKPGIRNGQTMQLPGIQATSSSAGSSCQGLGLEKPLQPSPQRHGRLPCFQDISLGQAGCNFLREHGHGDGSFLGLPRRGMQSVRQDIAEALREGVLPCPEQIADKLSNLGLILVGRRWRRDIGIIRVAPTIMAISIIRGFVPL
jgi:hypothetical protein